MKMFLISLLFVSTSSFAADSAVAPLKLSAACEDKVFKAAEALCNKVSKADEARDHDCVFWGDVAIKRNQPDSAYIEVDFTVTDADVYTIGVSIESKKACSVKVVNKTQQ